jgi:hypothetical protein
MFAFSNLKLASPPNLLCKKITRWPRGPRTAREYHFEFGKRRQTFSLGSGRSFHTCCVPRAAAHTIGSKPMNSRETPRAFVKQARSSDYQTGSVLRQSLTPGGSLIVALLRLTQWLRCRRAAPRD